MNRIRKDVIANTSADKSNFNDALDFKHWLSEIYVCVTMNHFLKLLQGILKACVTIFNHEAILTAIKLVFFVSIL